MAYLALLVLGGIFSLAHPAIGVNHWVAVGAAGAWAVLAVAALVAMHKPSPFDI